MKVIAKTKFLHIAPRKCRLVADLIRGMKVVEAQNQLKFLPKRSANAFLKLLNSAIASAEHNFNMTKDNLYISNVVVDTGPIMKRWMPRAFGRAAKIRKRTSHITLALDEKVKEKESKKVLIPKKEKAKKEVKTVSEKPKFKPVPEREKALGTKPKTNVFRKIFRRKSI